MTTYAVGRAAFRVAWFVALVLAFGEFPSHAQILDQVNTAPIRSANLPHIAGEELRTHSRPLTVDVDLVLVPATVTDGFNHPVTTLQKRDFHLFEENTEQDIRYFAEEDAPISIGILLDTSGSMSMKYELARQALDEFFVNSNHDDDYFVITYSNRPKLLADTTQSVNDIEDELAEVVPDGSTPLLDAIYLGLSKLKQARYERRALLIISDGGDNHSRYRAKEIREMVQESDVQIYSMGIFGALNITLEDHQGKKLLRDISEATGGRAEFFTSPAKLPETAARFSRELRNQYVLGYRPRTLQRDGKLHKVTVKVVEQITRPLQVSYKRQYLAAR